MQRPRGARARARPAEELTEEAAGQFAELAQRLRGRGHDPQAVAHFLDQLLFCLFAEDAGLLPKGLLARLAEATARPTRPSSPRSLGELFAKMADGRRPASAPSEIDWFNGGLFDGARRPAARRAPRSRRSWRSARLDWALIEPAIFGTLFERGLDPDQRAQLGAHYTDRASI